MEAIPTTKAVNDWVMHGISGELIGTYPFVPIRGGMAEAEVYWINDPDFVGVRFPDNARLAPGRGWLQYWRDSSTKERYLKLRNEWLSVHDPARLKAERKAAEGEPQTKGGFRLNLKNRPGGSLKLKSREPVTTIKPKLLLKPKKRS